MNNKKIIIAYVLEYIILIMTSFLVVNILKLEQGIGYFFYIETIVDFLLLVVLLIYSRKFLVKNVVKMFESVKTFLKNLFILLTTYVITFLAITISSSYLSMNSVSNYNQMGLESYFQISKYILGIKTIVIAPIIEEIVFRGVIFGVVRKKTILGAHIVTAIIFGLLHVWISVFNHGMLYLINIVPYIILSLGLSITYERTNNFIYAILFHMIHNGLTFAMMQV